MSLTSFVLCGNKFTHNDAKNENKNVFLKRILVVLPIIIVIYFLDVLWFEMFKHISNMDVFGREKTNMVDFN